MYFVQNDARGRESIPETECAIDDVAELVCQFPAFPGTVGWKFEFQRGARRHWIPTTDEPRFDPDSQRPSSTICSTRMRAAAATRRSRV